MSRRRTLQSEPLLGFVREVRADRERRGRCGGGRVANVQDVLRLAEREVVQGGAAHVEALRANAGGAEDELVAAQLGKVALERPHVCRLHEIAPHLADPGPSVAADEAAEAGEGERL